MKKILMVIAPNKFRDEEFNIPKATFENNDIGIDIASHEVHEATGMFGAKAKITYNLTDINVNDYNAIVFVGGIGVENYKTYNNPDYLNLAKDAANANKIIAAICLAPMILANAKLLDGKNATVFESAKEFIIERGAKYTNKQVVQDGNIITGNGPNAAKEFAEMIVKAI